MVHLRKTSKTLHNFARCKSFFNHFCTHNAKSGKPKVCIVGSGPGGFYAADFIRQEIPNIEIDLFERLPVPFGLVRFGVAPDHPEVKNAENKFNKLANTAGVRFIGNVSVGTDISLTDLKSAYHAIVLAYGADKDRKLNISGENLQNVISAREFVGWYNGVPADRHLKIDLDVEKAVILGQGNVALDVARILLSSIEDLKKTDITEHALELLSRSKVKEVLLVGRRGPLQVAFTTKEFREMLTLKDCSTIFNTNDFIDVQKEIPSLGRARKRLMELLTKTVNEQQGSQLSKRMFKPIFFRSPQRFLGSEKLEGIEFGINTVVGEKAVPTNEVECITCGLAFRSIGYTSEQIDPSIPFDSSRGRVVNTNGVVGETIYATGWAATGPVGIIVNTLQSSQLIAKTISSHITDGTLNISTTKPGFQHIEKLLLAKGIQIVNFTGWQKIDAEEKRRGKSSGKPREKIVDIKEMLKIASE